MNKKKNFVEWNEKMNEFFKMLCKEDNNEINQLKALKDQLKTLTDNITSIIFLGGFYTDLFDDLYRVCISSIKDKTQVPSNDEKPNEIRLPKGIGLPKESEAPKGIGLPKESEAPKGIKILKGPYFCGYLKNAKFKFDVAGFTRDFLLLGELHTIPPCDSNDATCVTNWIDNLTQNTPECLDFFIEGFNERVNLNSTESVTILNNKFMNSKITIDQYLSSLNKLRDLQLKSNNALKYSGGSYKGVSSGPLVQLRKLYNDDNNKITKYPNTRIHNTDIRQISINKKINLNIVISIIIIPQVKDLCKNLGFSYEKISEYYFQPLNIIDYLLKGKPVFNEYKKNEPFNINSFESNDSESNDSESNDSESNDSKKKHLTQLLLLMHKVSEKNNTYLKEMKSILDKQFNKSYLTKQHFIDNIDIFQDMELRVVKSLGKQGTSSSDDFNNLNNLNNFMLWSFFMDIYTLCRIFAKFDSSKMGRGPKICKETTTPKKVIFYGGAMHPMSYYHFIKKLSDSQNMIFELTDFKKNQIDFTSKFPGGFSFI